MPPIRGPRLRYHVGTSVRVDRRDGPEAGVAGGVLVGHASVFDQTTTLYEGRYWTWRETVRPGAFANAIREKQDVRSLFNHDPNFVLGRTASGTLELSEDKTGLLSRTTPPDTQTIRDLVIAPIERGDVTGMSFAFLPRSAGEVTTTRNRDGSIVIDEGGVVTTLRYEGDRLIEESEILDVDLYDVSPVTYPAYEGSACEMNSRAMPDLRDLIAEKDRPHKRDVPTPNLNGIQQRLDARAASARGHRQGTAAPGQKAKR